MADLSNKLCVITGGNSGIGWATAQKLAGMGTYMVLLCRDEERGKKARDRLISLTGNRGVELVLCDLALQYDVRKAAAYINENFDKLDLLINNAGTVPKRRTLTPDHIEKTFAVNHLSHFLLTNLLMDLLKAAPGARVINVSSEMHRRGARLFDPDDLQLEKNFSPLNAYGVTKLYNILFTRELARRTKNDDLTTYSLHPGTVHTRIASDSKWIYRLFYTLGKPFMKTPGQGAETPVFLATEPGIEEKNGSYFIDKRERKPAQIALNNTISEELWEYSKAQSELD